MGRRWPVHGTSRKAPPRARDELVRVRRDGACRNKVRHEARLHARRERRKAGANKDASVGRLRLEGVGAAHGSVAQLREGRLVNGRQLLGARVGQLETRMAQVVILAVVAAMLSPIIWGEIKTAFANRPAIHHLQRP